MKVSYAPITVYMDIFCLSVDNLPVATAADVPQSVAFYGSVWTEIC